MHGKRLTTNEVADYCGVNFLVVRKWILGGQLRAAQIPGRPDYHVELDDFVSFLKSNAMPVPRKLATVGHRVLIVDDDELMTQLIDSQLKEAGFATFVASDGLVGGATLESYKPTLMTLDIMMPGLDGMEVLKFIRGKTNLPGTKILVVSALPQEKLDEALKAGAHDTLRKPFDPKVLVDKMFALAGAAP
jgi:two-component system response regulator VicR